MSVHPCKSAVDRLYVGVGIPMMCTNSPESGFLTDDGASYAADALPASI